MKTSNTEIVNCPKIFDLCDAFLLLKNKQEVTNFLKDLCTPQEITALEERWRVCQLLENTDLSYRKIHTITGSSLTTIGRVARFLKTEAYYGYTLVLNKIKNLKNNNI